MIQTFDGATTSVLKIKTRTTRVYWTVESFLVKRLNARRQDQKMSDESFSDAVLDTPKPSKKILLLSNPLKLYLANVLTPCLDNEFQSEDKIMLKAIEAKGSHGKAKAFERLIQHMAESDNPLVKDKHTTAQTLAKWINECVTIGRDANARLEHDAGFGRNSAQEDVPAHVSAYCVSSRQYRCRR